MDADFFNETLLKIPGETEMRLRVSVSFSKRLRREQSLIQKKTVNFAQFCLKTTHPDQDETKTRLNKIEANKARPRQDCLKFF